MTDSPAYVELIFIFFLNKDKLKPVCSCRNWKKILSFMTVL